MEETKQDEILGLIAKAGFEGERGNDNRGFHTPSEVYRVMEGYKVTAKLMPTLRFLAKHIASGAGHETIHCFDVAEGSAELVNLLDESGITAEAYFPHNIETAFLAGVFHDIVLALKRESLETAIPRRSLEALVTPEYAKTWGDIVYLKGPIEDDLLGTAMLEVCGLGNNAELQMAVVSAAKDVPLVVPTTNATLLQKVLDAIWYHDGNYPLRGFAEADMIIGQRLPLYEDGRLSAEVMGQGIKKVLGYVDIEEGWEARSCATDITYLEKKLAKKAPGFLDAVKGTRAYQFIVEDLVPRQRSLRTMNSPAFWSGIDASIPVIERLQQLPGLMQTYGPQILQLAEKYRQVEQYRCKFGCRK